MPLPIAAIAASLVATLSNAPIPVDAQTVPIAVVSHTDIDRIAADAVAAIDRAHSDLHEAIDHAHNAVDDVSTTLAPTPATEAVPLADPAPAPQQTVTTMAAEPYGVWDELAQCESGQNWSINTGNGFYGGLQFAPSTWTGFGGGQYAPSAHLATREQQIEIARKVQAVQGWGAWPACTAKMGLR